MGDLVPALSKLQWHRKAPLLNQQSVIARRLHARLDVLLQDYSLLRQLYLRRSRLAIVSKKGQ